MEEEGTELIEGHIRDVEARAAWQRRMEMVARWWPSGSGDPDVQSRVLACAKVLLDAELNQRQL